MIQLNWYKIFGESHQIPDGRTVTPTDDIQIWLHCADIWDKTYTTLAEVLADTSTLVMLMAIDNAVDYLVRSTTWIGTALVPKMTSDNTPSGECIGDAAVSSLRAKYKAFDGDITTFYASSDNSADQGNIGYEFPTAQKIVCASAYVYNNSGSSNTTTIVLQASDDGVTFSDVSADVTNIITESGYQTFVFNATSVSSRAYYRLHRKTGRDRFWLNSIQFYSEGICSSEIAMKCVGASDYASTTLLSNSTWNKEIQSSPYNEWVVDLKVPKMTSNNTPSGVASASSTASTYEAFRAFDDDDSTSWVSHDEDNKYLQYDFGKSVRIFKMRVTTVYHSGQSALRLKHFSLLASSDDFATSDTLVSDTIANQSEPLTYEYVFDCPNSQSAYRMADLSAYTNNACIVTLQFFGREIGGVQTWLRSANITDKTYTTLAEVLADSTTLSALMSNHNAVDYLVTAKGWADDICADSTAMTLIGQNNYCANTLLADATWCEAICNSTYFESVLNVKVPVMTSNTTPSGECFNTYVESTLPAWKAFDGNSSTITAFVAHSPLSDIYVGYQFTSSVNVCKYFVYDSTSRIQTAKLVGSNDGVTWNDIDSWTVSNNNSDKVAVNGTKYTYYAFQLLTATHTSNALQINTLQFYGRQDV